MVGILPSARCFYFGVEALLCLESEDLGVGYTGLCWFWVLIVLHSLIVDFFMCYGP